MGLEYQDGSILYIKEEIFVNCLKQNALPDDDFNEKNSGEHDCIVGHDADRPARHPPLHPQYAPTVNGNQAIDYRATDRDDMVSFNIQRDERPLGTAGGIHVFQEEMIPQRRPTIDCNQSSDWRNPTICGHSPSISFASANGGGFITPSNISSSKLHNPQQESNEFYWDGEILYHIKDGKRRRLANFSCIIVRKYLLKSRRCEDIEMVRVKYIRTGGATEEIDIQLCKYAEENYSALVRKHPEFRLYSDSGQAKQLYRQYSSECFEASSGITWEICYVEPGWQKIGENTWHYFSERDEQCRSNRKLAPLDNIDLRDLALYASKILKIARLQVMLPTLLTIHHGVTKALLEDAGYTEDFITIFVGSTGSGKSYLARAFFTYFDGDFINFESTDCAIDIEMTKRIDAICVIDDLKSGNAKPLVNKLERVLRQIGDSVGRKKAVNRGSMQEREQEQVSVRCGVVITAESDPDALQESGVLRTLAISVRQGELTSSPLLKTFRDDIVLAHKSGRFAPLDKYMTAYIHFLEENYAFMVDVIAHMDFTPPPTIRPRQATVYRMMAIQAWLVLHFWQWCGLLPEEQAQSVLVSQWLPVLTEVLLDNFERGAKADPVILFLRAVSEGIASHRLLIADSKEVLNNSSTNYTGYWDDKVLKLLPDAVFDFVGRYYSSLEIQFVETQKGLLEKLYRKGGILEVYEQKDHKAKLLKKAKIRDVTVSVLCLRWDVVEQVLSEADASDRENEEEKTKEVFENE